jgi:hypothetical protein
MFHTRLRLGLAILSLMLQRRRLTVVRRGFPRMLNLSHLWSAAALPEQCNILR